MIYNRDCLEFLRDCKMTRRLKYRTAFLDPPDNVGYEYEGFTDKIENYDLWLATIVAECVKLADVVWLSFNAIHMLDICARVQQILSYPSNEGWGSRAYIWFYTFGSNRRKDCTPSYRPLLCLHKPGWKPDMTKVMVESARQQMGDKRAAPGGKVPNDVWEFPRVCGTFKRRRTWHSTQLPEELVERALLMSGDGPVFDPFLGSGTSLIVAKRLGRTCDGCEISPFYCEKIAELTGEPIA